MKKVMAALSGGVDSSVAVYLLQNAGCDCSGSIMTLHAPAPESVSDAKSIADRLGIPFYVMDCQDMFRKYVIDDFIAAYEKGDTPNPCIACNRHLKFTHFLREAEKFGCEGIATGHYARIRKDENTGRYLLLRAMDHTKDQSYFLYMLTQDQLSRVRFPLGELTKTEVRQIAEENGFINANRKDSQDICFVPDGDYVAFMEQYKGVPYACGAFLDLNGNRVGTHKGAVGYTIGQRKGLGLAMGAPVYVCDKDMENNTVTVGPEEALFSTTLIAENCNWFPFDALTEPIFVTAKARYRHKEQPATVSPLPNGRVEVSFRTPQRALTTGQAVVFYDGETVIGGGTICKIK
ncbi:MAG: tRNA 2-thiouridine(34) synthase MnmA [Ruminococcaceae bacterium]|nr:tRNA 2-thiouridine(34) synthase MnmA [Oscillospiraceae bacterium]